jgi:hypothetical protein
MLKACVAASTHIDAGDTQSDRRPEPTLAVHGWATVNKQLGLKGRRATTVQRHQPEAAPTERRVWKTSMILPFPLVVLRS